MPGLIFLFVIIGIAAISLMVSAPIAKQLPDTTTDKQPSTAQGDDTLVSGDTIDSIDPEASESTQMATEDGSKPIIKICYTGSGVEFLRALGWVYIIAAILVFLIYMFILIDLEFGIMPILLTGMCMFLAIMLFSGLCFALATIAENALIAKTIAKSKYEIREK